MILLVVIVALLLSGVVLWGWRGARRRHVALWLPSYLKRNWSGRREPPPRDGPVHVMFCVADHFEPAVADPGLDTERRRVEHWLNQYPELARRFRDADGWHPRHTFFYPAEQYRPEHLDRLGELVRAGFGEVDVHLHHDRDTSAGLREKLLTFAGQLRSHGLLATDGPSGAGRFAFVHGNWALDNSMPDGSWCGVNDELRVLRECGCYADFTFPSAPSPTQPRRINSLYYATDDPERPRSHDGGVEVRVGGAATGDLMIVQGPLTVRWPGGRWWVLPRLESGDLAGGAPPTACRVAGWVHVRVCVAGRPEWVFVKVHTHGCKEANWNVLFGPSMSALHQCLTERYNDGKRYRLHYVTAREMYNVIKAAEHGLDGDPGEYRDFEVSRPSVGEPRSAARHKNGEQSVERISS